MSEQEIQDKARHYLLNEHCSPLNDIMHQADLNAELQYHKDIENAYIAGAENIVKIIWHKESDHPNNRHPYPVINPDGEMAFAYYDELCGWQFDRDFPHSARMMWLDIEQILPPKN